MRSSLLLKSIIATIVLIQFIALSNAQVTVTTDPPAATTTTLPPVVTTTTPPPVVTTTSDVSSSAASSASSISSASSASSSSSSAASSSSSSSSIVSSSSSSSSSLSSSSSSSSSSTASSSSPSTTSPVDQGKQDDQNKTPIIVGSVVGGVVGIALIGGILAWINRRGGCSQRREKKKTEFEDYGLGDFPHHRPNPAMAAAAIPVAKPVSPTIPRLNDQGNYYNEDPNYAGQYATGYPEDYGMQQQQQGYYYPQQHEQQGYYDDQGYYYDNSNNSGAMSSAYSSVPPPMHQGQGGYAMNNTSYSPVGANQEIHKPDEYRPASVQQNK